MKVVRDSEEFIGQLAIWVSKNRTMEGFNIIETKTNTGVEYDAIVYSYLDPGNILIDKGPYKTMKGAMGAIGAALDRIENM